MAREVVTHIWCDVCLHTEDTYTEGTETPPITLGNMKPRVLGLCDVHTKDVYEPIKELLAQLGQVVPEGGTARFPGTSAGSGVWPCPDPACAKHATPFKHEQSLRNHAKKFHGVPITELRTMHAEVQQGDGDEALFDDAAPATNAPPVTEAACDQPGCGKVYRWPEIARPTQALGVHKAKQHGISGKAKAHATKGRAK